MVADLMKRLRLFIVFALVFQLIGCGTILYPERRGQTSGRIDAGVAILDAIGLLFFIIPGVIAFAVDFSTGAIYLPGTSTASVDYEDIKKVEFDPANASMASIERIIEDETGYDIDLERGDVKISKLKSADEMMTHFAQILPGMGNNRTMLSMQ